MRAARCARSGSRRWWRAPSTPRPYAAWRAAQTTAEIAGSEMSAEKLIVAGLCAGLRSPVGAGSKKENEPSAQPTVEQHSILVFPTGEPACSTKSSRCRSRRDRDGTFRFNGRLVWNEDRTARVFAPFAGRVQSIAVHPGERVARRPGAGGARRAGASAVAQAEARKAENDYSARPEERRADPRAGAGGRGAGQGPAGGGVRSRPDRERATRAPMRG